jgi:Protein of unknown function (DUF4012)
MVWRVELPFVGRSGDGSTMSNRRFMQRARTRWPGVMWARLRAAWSARARRPLDLARRPRVKASALIVILLCALVCATEGVALTRVVSLATALSAQAQRDAALAHSGVQALRDAIDALAPLREHPRRNLAPIAFAQRRLLSAYDDFRRLNDDVSAIPALAGTSGAYGEALEAARRLAPLAMEGAEAGIIGCDALGLVFDRLGDPLAIGDPLANGRGGLSQADMQTLINDTAVIDALFRDVKLRVAQLRPSDLRVDPRIASGVGAFRAATPQIEKGLQTAWAALPALGPLLGVDTPAHYLLQVMDSTELRPAGGFIGNYGILTLTGGRLGAIAVQDVDLLDAPFKYGSKRIPVPPVYQWFAQLIDHWAFRDSNLDADFPTAARYGEQLYAQEGGTTPVAGVVAITPWLIRDALKITGPINLAPDYQETITPDNLIERIHFHQLTPGVAEGPDNVIDPATGTSLRKRFTGVLLQHFMDTVRMQAALDIGPLLRLLMDALRHKDLQIYLNAEQAEKALQAHHLGATIEAPERGDSFFAVDANISANKSNGVLQYQMTEQVTLDASGAAVHQTTLWYHWPRDPATLDQTYPYTTSLPDVLHSYQRLYFTPRATITRADGWGDTDASSAFGRQVFAGDYRVFYGKTTSVRLDWKNPTAAVHDGAQWRYALLLQRQAGVTFALQISVALPPCAKLASALPAGFILEGSHTLTAHAPLASDLSIAIEYTC